MSKRSFSNLNLILSNFNNKLLFFTKKILKYNIYKPVYPYPVTLAIINLGFNLSNTSAPIPNFSSFPGLFDYGKNKHLKQNKKLYLYLK